MVLREIVRLQSAELNNLSGVEHGYFTCAGGVSTGLYASLNCGPGSSDDPASIEENRARAAAAFGATSSALATLHQIHSADVRTVQKTPTPSGPPVQADAAVTATPGVVLGILTADCAPVLFADRHAGVIGAAHAGWRGAFTGIVGATVSAMTALGAKPDQICAGIGPCIGPKSYEVGEEFRARFIDASLQNIRYFAPAPRDGHFLFDLPEYVADECRSTGVATVSALGRDSFSDRQNFFSYRRATLAKETDYGRNLSAICLT